MTAHLHPSLGADEQTFDQWRRRLEGQGDLVAILDEQGNLFCDEPDAIRPTIPGKMRYTTAR